MNRNFDIILWGATGFTGQLVAKYLAAHNDVRWALAGRNREKLEALRTELTEQHPALEVGLLTADSHDLPSLERLAEQTTVICSTVGPYALHGEPVVQACVEKGTHYCDLTGEVPFMWRMKNAYHEAAEQNGVKIVHACGYDSIPSDIGTFLVQDSMQQRHGVACQKVKHMAGAASGGFSGGTIASLLNVLAEAERDPAISAVVADPYALYPEDAEPGPDKSERYAVAWDEKFQSWTAPFVMASINTRVVRRSNALRDYPYGRDFRYVEVMGTGKGARGWFTAQAIRFGLVAFMRLGRNSLARGVLSTYVLPKSGEGPSPAAQKAGFFNSYFVGLAGEHTLYGFFAGERDPGYGSTSIMLAESALCLAHDQELTPEHYGVLTPSAAMGGRLVERLREAGFQIVVSEDRDLLRSRVG